MTNPPQSDTPRTDELEKQSHEKHVHLKLEHWYAPYWCFTQADMANHARQLERELAEANRELDKYKAWWSKKSKEVM